MFNRWALNLGALLLAAGTLVAAARADGINPKDVSETAKYLGAVYKDENAGFKLCPPAGARVINRAGLELMSFVHDTKQWGGNFQEVNMDKDFSIDDYMKTAAAELSKTFKAVQVLDSKTLTFQGMKAGRLTASMEAEVGPPPQPGQVVRPRERIALLRQQLILQRSPQKFLVLTFWTPLKDRDEAILTFEAMLTSVEFMDKKKLDDERVAAARAGKLWLAQRSANELKSKLLAQPQLFRMKIDNTDIGFVRFDEGDKERDAKTGALVDVQRDGTTGIMVAVNSRTFPSDGSIVIGQNEAFWAFTKGNDSAENKLHYSMWMNKSKTDRIIPNPDRKKFGPNPTIPYSFWISELGTLQMDQSTQLSDREIDQLRKQREEMLKDPKLDRSKIPPAIEDPNKVYRMMVSRQGDPSQELSESTKALNITIPDNRPSPLPKILEYVWPRLVDLTKPSEMSFLVYNSATGKPALRTLIVHGADRVMIDGKPVDCYRLSDELDPGSTTIWVDRTGRILMMKTSDQAILLPTTEEQMSQLWGKRLGTK